MGANDCKRVSVRRVLLIMFDFPDGMSTSLGSPGKGEGEGAETIYSPRIFHRIEAGRTEQVREIKSCRTCEGFVYFQDFIEL